MKDVSKLLDKVIDLIEGDVNEIGKLAGTGKLEHGVSSDLCRYSATLLDLNQSLEERERAERTKVSRMSTEELEKRARELLSKKETK